MQKAAAIQSAASKAKLAAERAQGELATATTAAEQAAEADAKANAEKLVAEEAVAAATAAEEEKHSAAPPAKKKRVTRPTAASWKELIAASDFARVRITVGGETLGLRPNQEDELKGWAAGTWDSEWLLVRFGVPHCFVSQSGDQMKLQLDGPRGSESTASSSTAVATETAAAKAAAVTAVANAAVTAQATRAAALSATAASGAAAAAASKAVASAEESSVHAATENSVAAAASETAAMLARDASGRAAAAMEKLVRRLAVHGPFHEDYFHDGHARRHRHHVTSYLDFTPFSQTCTRV